MIRLYPSIRFNFDGMYIQKMESVTANEIAPDIPKGRAVFC
jgi:hypothetical protein